MNQEEQECNAAIRLSARRGKFTVTEGQNRNRETGRFVGNASMNELIRGRAGRTSAKVLLSVAEELSVA
jgi:hypothetical protein